MIAQVYPGERMKNDAPRRIMSSREIDIALSRIASEIVESTENLDRLALVGIRRRGIPLARTLRKKIEESTGLQVPLGKLDITFYRDDLSLVDSQPVVGASHLDFEVQGKWIVLVDDVLFTGRTVRAALESLLDYGRPCGVKLAVLVDRGHRELPIQADYVGEYVDTAVDEIVDVHLPEFDGDKGVYLSTRQGFRKSMNS